MTLTIMGLGEGRKWPGGGARVWGLPWDREYAPYCERLFEMHARSLWMRRGPGYLVALRDYGRCHIPIYMHEGHRDIPESYRYPFDIVSTTVWQHFPRLSESGYGQGWYNSSPAYMLALALAEGEKDIRLEGINVKSASEWAYEQPCLSYLCGWAAARGVRITVHPNSDLLRFHPNIPFDGVVQSYMPALYGIPAPPPNEP